MDSKGPPYPTSRDLVGYLAAETPDSVRYAINDLFETITQWDFRTVTADAVKRPDGKYEVTLRAAARKYRSDGLGVEREIPIADLVDVGVFGKAGTGELGKPLYLSKAWIRNNDPTFTIVVDEEPGRAGIDPYGKLIDRDRKDNVARVETSRRSP